MSGQPDGASEQQAVPVTREKLPTRCDGKEQYAFEAWAAAQRYDMNEHPMHYLFLDARTDAARGGWAAGLAYASEIAARLASASSASAEGFVLVPRDQLRAWYTGAWVTWLETIGDNGDEEPAPPQHVRELEAAATSTTEPVPATDPAGEVERDAIAAAIGKADDACGYSYRMTGLVDGIETHTLFMDGFEPVSFEDRDDGYELIAQRRNQGRADAILAALATQPATSQEGEGWISWRGAVEGYEQSLAVATKELGDEQKARSVLWLLGLDHVWKHIDALRATLAATLSEDLREALEVLCAGDIDASGTALIYGTDPRVLLENARAALVRAQGQGA